jgi:outer membrane protein assembly factor BamB
MSSYRGLNLDMDAENLFVSTSDGEVVALRRRTGAELWRQNALLHRGLSAPAVSSDAVIVADFQGYVHWLDKSTGAVLARARAGKKRIGNPPIAAGNMVFVINDNGGISAFRATLRRGAVAAPAAPPAGDASAPAQPAPADAVDKPTG